MLCCCSTLEKVERSSAPRSTKEGGLLLDRTANHFFLFCQRKGLLVWNLFLQNSVWEISLLLCLIVYINRGNCFDQFCSALFSDTSLWDLPDHLDVDEGTNRRREKQIQDTFVLVKEYISSTELRQPPLLVLTPESKASYTLTTNRILPFWSWRKIDLLTCRILICWTHWMTVWDKQTKNYRRDWPPRFEAGDDAGVEGACKCFWAVAGRFWCY